MAFLDNFDLEREYPYFMENEVGSLPDMLDYGYQPLQHLMNGPFINDQPAVSIDPKLLDPTLLDPTLQSLSVPLSTHPQTNAPTAAAERPRRNINKKNVQGRCKKTKPAAKKSPPPKPTTTPRKQKGKKPVGNKSRAPKKSSISLKKEREHSPTDEEEVSGSDFLDESSGPSGSVEEVPKVRTTAAGMEWFDDTSSQWRPARYHRDCREELLAHDAQKYGYHYSTEDGNDKTSYSSLAQGWIENNLASYVDSQGRPVFDMGMPADFDRIPRYDHLIINNVVILDHHDKPVRDIPGLPLTLAFKVPGVYLEALRRCKHMEINDFLARVPGSWTTKTGVERKQLFHTAISNRMNKFMDDNGIAKWYTRPSRRLGARSEATTQGTRSRRTRRTNVRPLKPEARATSLSMNTQASTGPYPSGSEIAAESPLNLMQLGDQANPVHVEEDWTFADGADFVLTPPRTPAEIAFVQTLVGYTRTQYEVIMKQPAPVTDHHASYQDQHHVMQADLLRNWPYDNGPPVTLRAVGPFLDGI